MIGTSTLDGLLIRVSVAAISAVTPLSIAFCIIRPFFSSNSPTLLALEAWPFAESLFFLFVYLPLKERSRRAAVHPPLLSLPDRETLFAQCVANIPDPAAYLSRWFMDAPLREIKRDNLKEFFCWAWLNSSIYREADQVELESYVDQVESATGLCIAAGRGDAKCLRLTIDEPRMLHRPLIWYMIVFGADQATHLWLLYHRFNYYRKPLISALSIVPFRPLTTLTTKCSPVKQLSYWMRPHTSKTKLPIVFLHGIGIGLLTYIPFLAELNQSSEPNDQIGIIAIELLPISFRITQAMPDRKTLCDQMKTILQHHGFAQFVLVAHSYGTVITTHLLKDPDIAPQIASVVLIDPVTILLHLPDVAYNFTYRTPSLPNERQLHYFASTDLGVSHTLARTFFWSANILWPPTITGTSTVLGPRPCAIFLGARDLIVPTRSIWRFLTTGAVQSAAEAVEPAPEVWVAEGPSQWMRVFWAPELDHAQIFDRVGRRRRLVDEVLELAETVPRDESLI